MRRATSRTPHLASSVGESLVFGPFASLKESLPSYIGLLDYPEGRDGTAHATDVHNLPFQPAVSCEFSCSVRRK